MKYLFILLLFASCASRKVNKEDIKIDKVEVVNNDIQIKEKIDIKIVDSINEIYIEPIDTIKPMVIDGKTYLNAKISYKKRKVNTTIISDKTTSDLSVKKIEEKESIIKKDIERKSSLITDLWWLWLLILMFIIYKLK